MSNEKFQHVTRINNAILNAVAVLSLEEVLQTLLQNAEHLSCMLAERVTKEVRG